MALILHAHALGDTQACQSHIYDDGLRTMRRIAPIPKALVLRSDFRDDGDRMHEDVGIL